MIVDRQEERETACEQADDQLGFDPECRFANDGTELAVLHVCTTSFGEMVRPGQSCFAESRAQLAEQGRVIDAAERAVQ